MEGSFSLTVHFTNKLDRFSWSLSGIYGPNVPHHRQDFWQELIDLHGHANNAWIQTWKYEEFGRLDTKIQDFLSTITELDSLEENQDLSSQEILKRAEAKIEVERLHIMIRIKWQQRAKIDWRKSGDKNTPFFHMTASSRKRTNHIEQLLIEDRFSSDREVIKKHY
ncbi:hypothetical protein BVC80_1227g32 [Macleaya cordata]|uniref:Uncharacterized protein n=1 Tax=Macleaya cordata TaxID=56857 RepID=A0A200R8C1_MACCD|nr:hypothetical protein BVC80_1227g32 [Macleaya cordata]